MNLDDYKDLKNFKYFYEISAIPRESFHEEQIADYIENFAKERKLEYRRDALGSIVIKKPGTKGRENEAPVILQAHTDMVCQKTPESTHDFRRDPLDLYMEDGWIKARGTTLGADDGVGVAMILAVLDENDISHPPLECLLTVQEEDGMGGAKNLDLSDIHAKRMIGIDGEEGGITIYTGAYVDACKYSKTFDLQPVTGNVYELSVGGLTSGHGASRIGYQRANANKLVTRILKKLGALSLIDMNGGKLMHVITRECTAHFASALPCSELQKIVDAEVKVIRKEYAITDPGMTVEFKQCDPAAKGLSESDSDKLLTFMHLLPVGAVRQEPENLNNAIGSFNLSIVKLNEGSFEGHYVCRANPPIDVKELRLQAQEFADIFGFDCETTMAYSGFRVPTDTPLTEALRRAYTAETGKELGLRFMHSGFDIGTVFERQGIEDMVLIFADTPDVHSTGERLNAESFKEMYGVFKKLLAEI